MEKWMVCFPTSPYPNCGQANHETQCQKKLILRAQPGHSLFFLVCLRLLRLDYIPGILGFLFSYCLELGHDYDIWLRCCQSARGICCYESLTEGWSTHTELYSSARLCSSHLGTSCNHVQGRLLLRAALSDLNQGKGIEISSRMDSQLRVRPKGSLITWLQLETRSGSTCQRSPAWRSINP